MRKYESFWLNVFSEVFVQMTALTFDYEREGDRHPIGADWIWLAAFVASDYIVRKWIHT